MDPLLMQISLIFTFLFQLVRQAGISFAVYKSYNALVIEQHDSFNFDTGMEGMDYEVRRRRDADKPNSTYPANDPMSDWLQFCVPSFEILMSVIILMLFMGPGSPGIPVGNWLRWLMRLRMAWMHMLWTMVAGIYVFLYSWYRTRRYKDTDDEKYLDTATQMGRMWCTVAEYACLGTVQSVIEIYTLERLEKRVKKARKEMGSFWGHILVVNYLMCTATYAFRNFSMSLYFGLLSAFVTQTEQLLLTGSNLLGLFNFIIVMQIYLALMRGSYFDFFIRLFTGFFLCEADEFKFVTADEEEERKMKSRSKERRRSRTKHDEV